MTKSLSLTAVLLLATSPAALAAQQATPAQDQPDQANSPAGSTDGASPEEIIVTGERERGAVIGDIQPEEQLDAGDVASYGVSSVGELLDALSPQTSSGRGRSSGRPVVLLNGRRISGFSEIRDLPTEAIERVDILPEEVALKYGYRADQRVVNFVLKEHFSAYTAELEDTVPTAGGSNNFEAKGNYVAIEKDNRFTLDLQAETTSKLLESERDITASPDRTPYDLSGNVTALPGAASDEIDPALSALYGQPVTVAGAPAGETMPDLADFSDTANITDTTPYRTLQPSSQRVSANATLSRTVFGDVGATANIRLENEHSESLQGLPGVMLTLPSDNPFSPFSGDTALYRYTRTGDPLTRATNSFTGHAGFTLNSAPADWQWSVTGNYDRAETRTRTETGVDPTGLQTALDAGDPLSSPFALLSLPRLVDRARSVSSTGGLDGTLTGDLFALPAGDVSTTLKLGAETSDFSSRSTRAGVRQTADLGRDSGDAQINFDLPVSDPDKDVLGWIGELSLNGNAEIEQLSDFGTLTSIGYGLHWRPIDDVRFLASYTQEQGAPSTNQLGDPVVTTPNARIFDYVTGQTVDITRIDGGNPNLRADDRHVLKLGLDVKPLSDPDIRISTEYIRETIDDPINSFPSATAAIEAAFPDRFVRDAGGQLVQVDARPVNFQRSERQQLRWGINFSKRLEAPRSESRDASGRRSRRGAQDDNTQGDQKTSDSPAKNGNGEQKGRPSAGDDDHQSRGGGPPGGGRHGRGGGRHGRGGGRIRVSLYHTIHLRDRIFIRDGVPALDLLNGDATGNSGGQPRHEVELRGGYYKEGLGFRLKANWQSATDVDGGATGGDSLHFSSLATFDLRLFANLGEQASLMRDHPWLENTRVSLSIDNILDTRQTVTDASGTVPLSYQDGYIDPLGRTIRLSIRKQF